MCGLASTMDNDTKSARSGYHLRTSTSRNSASSVANSHDVAPPPTTTKCSMSLLSSSVATGLAALSKHSKMRSRMRRAWYKCLRKKTASCLSWVTSGTPNVFVLQPALTTKKS